MLYTMLSRQKDDLEVYGAINDLQHYLDKECPKTVDTLVKLIRRYMV
jgi:hypothetical protein